MIDRAANKIDKNVQVSVIVPVYNVEKYIRECLLSIQDQTLQNIEIIVIDDGSTDNSIGVIQDLIDSDERIKVIRKENGGLSSARNAGLDLISGKYISFVDGDDTIGSTFLADLFDECEKEKLDIVLGGYTRVNLDGTTECQMREKRLLQLGVNSGKELTLSILLSGFFWSMVWLNLYRNEFIQKNHFRFENGLLFEDEDFSPQVFLKAERVKFVGNINYFYYERAGSIMSTKTKKKINSSERILNKYIKLYQESDLNKKEYAYFIENISNLYFGQCAENLDKRKEINFALFREAKEIVKANNILSKKTEIKQYIKIGLLKVIGPVNYSKLIKIKNRGKRF